MIFINKLIFLSLFWVVVFFTSRYPQTEISSAGVTSAASSIQTKFSSEKYSAPGGNVCAGLQDQNGNLWFVTTGQGVYRYDGTSFTNFTTRDGLVNDLVFWITEDKKGNLWFGTVGGVSRFDGKTFTDIPVPNKFVTNILEDRTGKLWFGTQDGVYVYDGKVFTRLLDQKNLVNNKGLALRVVQQMLEDRHGNIWITTKDEGICRYDGKSIINYTPNDVLWFRGLFEDKDGNVLAGGKNIVCRYDGKTFTSITGNGTFDSSTVYSITQDRSGKIWFSTEASDASERESEGGVWLYDGKSFKHFSKRDGLSHAAVWCIVEDKAGKFWFGTRRGLSRYDGKTFTNVLN